MAPTECWPHGLVDVLDGDRPAFERAGQDRPAIDEDRGDVEAAHGHHHPGLRLVAARDADQRVVGMAAHRQFEGSAITSREGSEDFIPPWPMAMPSVTVMVQIRVGWRRPRRRRASPPAPGASGRCCRARPRSSRSPHQQMAGESAPGSGPWHSKRRGAAPAPALRWRGGLAASISDWSLRPCHSAGLHAALAHCVRSKSTSIGAQWASGILIRRRLRPPVSRNPMAKKGRPATLRCEINKCSSTVR